MAGSKTVNYKIIQLKSHMVTMVYEKKLMCKMMS